jgi:hypothetical protein
MERSDLYHLISTHQSPNAPNKKKCRPTTLNSTNKEVLGPLVDESTPTLGFTTQIELTRPSCKVRNQQMERFDQQVNILPRFKKCTHIGIKLSQCPTNSILLDKIGLLNKDSTHT